jgi:hypothetical protein
VVLFDNGLAYFQREGEVLGNAQLVLKVPARDVNDLLKSIVTEDTGGGHIAAVRLEPPFTPGGSSDLASSLTAAPSLLEMLSHAKGEQVEITLHPKKNDPQPTPLSGTILGVHDPRPEEALAAPADDQPEPKKPASEEKKETPRPAPVVNLLGPQGVASVPLSRIKNVRFLDPHMAAELQRGAAMLSDRRGMELQTLRLQFTGTGRRTVRVGYVTEHPLWRTSYRLLLAKEGKATLQGWALLENISDEDWQNVSLTLMAGQPYSFQTDLATPLQLHRPVHMPWRYAGLQNKLPVYPFAPFGFDPFGLGGMTGRRGGGLGGLGGGLGGLSGGMGGPGAQMLNPKQGIRALAETERTGDFYRYTLSEKVSVPRRQAAMLPVLQRPIAGDAFTLYSPNEQRHGGSSLLSFRLKNDTGMQLSAGPVTVVDQAHYSGEAMLEDLLPQEEATLSYARDLASKVKKKVTTASQPNGPLTVQISSGGLHITEQEQRRTELRLSRSQAERRRVMIEHPVSEGWKLVKPAPWKEEGQTYLLETETPPGQEQIVEIIEAKPTTRAVKWPALPTGPYRYLLDDNTELTLEFRSLPSQLQTVRLRKGMVEETRRHPVQVRYTLKQHGPAREVTLIHFPPGQAAITQTQPAPTLQTKEGWHFRHQLPANGSAEQTLREDRQESATWNLAQADRTRLLQLRDDPAASAAVQAAVRKVLDFQEQGARLENDRTAVRDRLAEIELDQRRLRANLKELPPTSTAYKKHLEKFDKQEEELEKLVAEEKRQRQTITQLQKERETFLANVTAE